MDGEACWNPDREGNPRPDQSWWDFSVAIPPPGPPTDLGPFPNRPICFVDAWGVFLADPNGALIGVDTNWGRGGPLIRLLDAGRDETLNL